MTDLYLKRLLWLGMPIALSSCVPTVVPSTHPPTPTPTFTTTATSAHIDAQANPNADSLLGHESLHFRPTSGSQMCSWRGGAK